MKFTPPRFCSASIIVFLLFSCSNLRTQTSNSAKYETQAKDIDSISFVVNGNSILQSSRDIDSLKFRFNLSEYNLNLKDSFEVYNDTSIFKQYRLRLNYEETSGLDEHLRSSILFIVKKSSNEIIRMCGYFVLMTFDENLDNEELPCRLLSYVTEAYFPILEGKTKCEDWWSYTIEKKDFREIFVLEPPVPNESMPYEPIYNFYYDVSFNE